MKTNVWLICEEKCPIAAVETEADAEELFMDLVIEWQCDIAMARMHFNGDSMKELMSCEWIWLSNGEYWITCIPQL